VSKPLHWQAFCRWRLRLARGRSLAQARVWMVILRQKGKVKIDKIGLKPHWFLEVALPMNVP
jgi:hypothetical protein